MSRLSDRLHVLIAGSGVAGFETLLALHSLAGDRLRTELLTPDRKFVYRPLAVAEPFGFGEAYSFDLPRLLAHIRQGQSFVLRYGSLQKVDIAQSCAYTLSGKKINYDVLVVATGARAVATVPGAVTFGGPQDSRSLEDVVSSLIDGRAKSVAFVATGKVSWTLPTYELALMTSVYLVEHGVSDYKVVIVTVEEEPLSLFGAQASLSVRKLLEEHGIELHTGKHAVEVENGRLLLAPADQLAVDCVVALAGLEGLGITGLPTDGNGFIHVDQHGQVSGAENVYAAGDATTFPIKQGGVASQQADAVAEAIAARVGAIDDPAPFRPVLRGLLLAGTTSRYLHSEIAGGKGDVSRIEMDPLWWPPSKIAGRYLAPHLAEVINRSLKPHAPPTSRSSVSVDIDLESENEH